MPLLVYVLVCFNALFVRANSKKYALRPEMKLKPDVVTEQLKVSTNIECIVACESRLGCRTASWGSSLQTCLLSNEDITLIWSLDEKIDWRLELESGWMTYVEMIYPVIHVNDGRYKLNFADAQQACLALNTTLATEGHMLAAREMGLGACGCGWFDNGMNGFVLQGPLAGCGLPYSAGIIYCYYSNAYAWCVFA